jgi:predicted transcriptional regulator
MAKSKEKEFEAEVPVADDEDEATLAAIDEGLHDAESGRTVPIEKVRELLPKWISDSSSPKKR